MNTGSPKSMIYLDNQATTPLSLSVFDAMRPHLVEKYGNPHSGDHWFGWQAKKSTEFARKQVAELISADPDEVIFTSGATEANNLAILGALNGLTAQGKNKLIVSEIEHKCVLACYAEAEKRGFKVIRIMPNTDGQITPETLEGVMDEGVGLVSIMTVNNEIGTIQPIEQLASIARRHGALFHTDAAQASVFLTLNMKKMPIDLLSLSSHKMYGPAGIGALFISRDIKLKIKPVILGGGQEDGFRSGTLPTMLCVGFGEACKLAKKNREENASHLKRISDHFLGLLQKQLPYVQINGSLEKRHPGNLNVRFPNTDAHSLIQSLQPRVAASTGSACTTGTPEPSYVLRAIGLSEEEAKASLRFSFGLQNTKEDIEHAVECICDTIKGM